MVLFINKSTRKSSSDRNQTQAETKGSQYILGFLLLAGASLIFGSSLPVMKDLTTSLSPQLLTTGRCTIGALVLSPLLFNLNKLLIRDGAILGSLFFGCCFIECVAMEGISASRAGFTFALSIVFVTLLEILQGKSISLVAVICGAAAFVGIALMSWQSEEPIVSSIWMIVATILDSAYLIIIERAVLVHPPLKLAAVSCWIPAIFGLIWSAPQLASEWTAVVDNIWGLVYVGAVAVAIAVMMETTAQQWVPGNEVAIFRTLEPISAALLSFWFLGETFNGYDYLGSAMVLVAVIWLALSKGRKREDSKTLETNPELGTFEASPKS